MQESIKNIKLKAARRARRVRAKFSGTSSRPRMSVHFSLTHLYVQCIDDVARKTVFAMSDKNMPGEHSRVNKEMARALGKQAGEAAKGLGIKAVIFDRGSRAFHGRMQAFAEGAREGGLTF